ncbi:MAG: Mob1/phocein, partial [Piptocephalis tieghemiana]
PRGVDENEWLAANTCDFFNHLNLFYGAIADYCTTRECPSMSAGPGTDFTWTDASKKSLKLAAPTYVDYVMSWVQNLIDSEDVFPTKSDNGFSQDFVQTVRAIFKQLHRIFAHIYFSHYDQILGLHTEGHLNSLYAHFIVFSREFDLLEKKELSVMADLVSEMEAAGRLR